MCLQLIAMRKVTILTLSRGRLVALISLFLLIVYAFSFLYVRASHKLVLSSAIGRGGAETYYFSNNGGCVIYLFYPLEVIEVNFRTLIYCKSFPRHPLSPLSSTNNS